MSRSTRFTALTILSAGALSACMSIRPHSRADEGSAGAVFQPRRPGGAPNDGDIGGRGLPAGAPAAVAGRSVGVRRVCRAGSRPSGWIAVAYVSAGEGDCALRAKSDSSASAAILTYYADLQRDATLDVCADETIPRGWVVENEAVGSSDACPGVERNGSSTVHIRRVR